MITKYEDIDLGLEKMVFLCNAEEGNPGIYELIYELSYYNLPIEDKYKIAHQILISIMSDGLVSLDRYTNISLDKKLETISIDNAEEFLNNPSFWYPSNEILSIELTEKGQRFLEENYKKYSDRLSVRFGEKKQ
nr:hypothetical protein [uncultured Draconibacterium sp.]